MDVNGIYPYLIIVENTQSKVDDYLEGLLCIQDIRGHILRQPLCLSGDLRLGENLDESSNAKASLSIQMYPNV